MTSEEIGKQTADECKAILITAMLVELECSQTLKAAARELALERRETRAAEKKGA